MALVDEVFEQLKATGQQLKKDLWQREDLETLRLIASDLVGLNRKLETAEKESDRKRFSDAVTLTLHHAQLLALSRLNVTQNDVAEALKSFFMKVVSEWLPKLLKTAAVAVVL